MFTQFPTWLELSGLPVELNGRCKSPLAWSVFRKLVELDVAANQVPATVEISADELATLVGLSGTETLKVLGKLRRKGGVLRMFLPETTEEPALVQVRVPLETPIKASAILDRHHELGRTIGELRYALAEGGVVVQPLNESRLKQIIDLYLDGISMKMNSFVLEELKIIAQRYDIELVKKIFARAKKRERQNLGWIVTEIRRELGVSKGIPPASS